MFSVEAIKEWIMMIPIVLIALTFHEFAHAWVSTKLGDPTPRMTGRLSLNPLAHLDPVGAILMLVTRFGWAKPVQINASYYKNPKLGMALTAAAGPLMNLLIAIVSMLLYTLVFIITYKTRVIPEVVCDNIGYFLQLLALVNLSFMVFNIIPIPPLDGSRVLSIILPTNAYFWVQKYERYSFILIIVLSLSGFFGRFIGAGVGFIMNQIIGLCNLIVQAVL